VHLGYFTEFESKQTFSYRTKTEEAVSVKRDTPSTNEVRGSKRRYGSVDVPASHIPPKAESINGYR
jgi:hypothetical protein